MLNCHRLTVWMNLNMFCDQNVQLGSVGSNIDMCTSMNVYYVYESEKQDKCEGKEIHRLGVY